ncbi:lysine--tRNA ligase [Candidatus Wolfebacteria bacterium]|nr:MAG: lysine--tRNA ligase [Candidatus Wolfebacteria bacterium]
MASLEELRLVRLEKLEKLKKAGLDPYPAASARTHTIKEVRGDFDALESSNESVIIAGRVMALRGQGALHFFNIFDGTDSFQGLLKRDEMDAEHFDLFSSTIDIGDFIEITGTLFTTKRGEPTVAVRGWKILTKSLLPLPDGWSGFKDTEERLRKRYLDILMNSEVREMVEQKSRFWSAVRSFLVKRDFLEVETPILEVTTGGADAEPFKTHHNALDMDIYLRISCGELWQKRLMVSGIPKTFEIGRIFRNEGMSAEHLQDYTQMEFYWAYADYEDGMELVTELYRHIAKEAFGTQKFTIGEFDVDLGVEWKRYDYRDTIEDKTGVDISTATFEEIEKKLQDLNIDYARDGFNKNRAIDTLWKYCRKQITGPGFLIGLPAELAPLAKRDTTNENITQHFQPIIAGSELGRGYSELNDPLDQRARFEEQQAMRDAGDPEAQMADLEFVEALEHGMPPTCGYGMSERVFAFLSNKPVRDTQIFPLVKPKE